MTDQSTAVAEIVTFGLIAGTDPAAFAEAAQGTHEAVSALPGFRARTLTQGEDGRWTDHVIWASMADARSAAKAIMAIPAFKPFGAMIDGGTVTMRHEHIRFRVA